MIARGDLAVEPGFERLAELQEEILWLCEASHVPAIWATQEQALCRSSAPDSTGCRVRPAPRGARTARRTQTVLR